MTAFVVDPETNPDALTYEWTGASGTFFGAGRAVTWRAPASLAATPVDVTLTVTVIERFIAPDPQGLPKEFEHRVPRTFNVRVHNSTKEISDLASEFLNLFSNSNVPPATVVSGFSTSTCAASTAQELADVVKNRCLYTINSFFVGPPASNVNFRGICTIGPGTTAPHAAGRRVLVRAGAVDEHRQSQRPLVPGAGLRAERRAARAGLGRHDGGHRHGHRRLRGQPLAAVPQRLPRRPSARCWASSRSSYHLNAGIGPGGPGGTHLIRSRSGTAVGGGSLSRRIAS